MKYMGIDYGEKRVGLAFSNEDGTMAFPREVLQNTEKLLEELLVRIKEESVGAIVIGHSIGKDGAPNKVQARIEGLIQELTLETGLPIHLEPEQYTTQESLRIQGRTEKTDASAAALILNSYLTRVK
jgi:putative holliday junction resolvase